MTRGRGRATTSSLARSAHPRLISSVNDHAHVPGSQASKRLCHATARVSHRKNDKTWPDQSKPAGATVRNKKLAQGQKGAGQQVVEWINQGYMRRRRRHRWPACCLGGEEEKG